MLPLVRGSSCSPFFFVLCVGCGGREGERTEREGRKEKETGRRKERKRGMWREGRGGASEGASEGEMREKREREGCYIAY